MQPKIQVSLHAIERARERLDVKGTNNNVTNTLRAWFTRAVRKGRDNASGMIYDNVAKDVRIITDELSLTIKTVYRLSTVDDYTAQKMAPKLTTKRITSAVKRELKRMSTQYQREIRKMTEQKAELGVLVAELTLNHVRCNAPHTKMLIQSRIDETTAQITKLAEEIDVKLTKLQQAEKEVKAVVGE